MTKTRIVRPIALFALGFATIATALHLAVGPTLALHADMRSEKLRLLADSRGHATSAAFGSSHIHYGFDPRAFDAALATTPQATHTINLAVAGGSQSEQRALALAFVHQLAAAPKPQPTTLILLELTAGANFTREHLVHPRAIDLYDWPTTRFVLHLTSPKMSLAQRTGRTAFALIAFTLHSANVGMLSSRLFPAPLDTNQLTAETIADRRGLLVEERRPGVLDQLRDLEQRMPPHPTITRGELLPGNRDLAEELIQADPSRSIEPVYIILPKISDLAHETIYSDSLPTSEGPIPILNLARPDLYPQLYAPELWLDDAHLAEPGARLASTLLAQSLISWQATHANPQAASPQAARSPEAGKP